MGSRGFDLILHRTQVKLCNELRGVKKPYKEVIDVSWGDPHRAGVKPLTFVRQVLAACLYPQLIDSDKLPVDVRQRAQMLLGRCAGGSVGSYTATAGIPKIVQRVSEFITRRDGGVPSNPKNIYISPGSQWALTNIFNILANADASPRTGVLAPVPCHSTTILSIMQQGAMVVPYHLNEEQGWALQVEELQQALESAKGVCNPVALYVINPGNPAGLIQSRKSMQEVIQFVSEKKLFLLADEVYQDCVHGENSKFVSYKRVLKEMGPPLSETVELASFHSASKGFMGECGLRGGYVELVNLDPAVMKYIYTLFSTDACAPILGQIALDLMTHPPQQGDPSYPLYYQETEHIRATLIQNVKKAFEAVNSLPGFSCQPVQGGAFAFPRVHLPPKAIQKAKEEGLKPDTFYCIKLLEEVGVMTSPGAEYGQKEGTYHIRFCIMTTQELMEEFLNRLTNFQIKFMRDFS
ncbi:alanine aminotransferase 2-like isoform X3 [Melanotaenia boesemani]|uniref:alanine aminotransferase 2-like isoform X3 n=1 Tax=Melanotaenia boesemani TaxID=1250792 RepID=UPI001C05DCD2|nr:alanine aminotransferase 2-like isoform X3 [Melanotaenia boesemani]